jgi:hypothetical protein
MSLLSASYIAENSRDGVRIGEENETSSAETDEKRKKLPKKRKKNFFIVKNIKKVSQTGKEKWRKRYPQM